MNLLICCTCFWKTAFPCLCWGVIGLIALYFILKFLALPCLTNRHERKMKEEAFKREKEWNNLINIKASTDETLNDKIKNLTTSIEKLKKELESEKNNKGLLEKQLKLYSDIFEKLNVEIRPKEK